MSETTEQVRKARIFVQLEELVAYDLVQCGGLTAWNKPRGALTPIREQSLTTLGEEEIVAFQRASADMATFTVRSRLKAIANFMLNLKCQTNWQVHLKDCSDPTDYYKSSMAVAWQKCPPGDMTGEALAVIEGDNVAIHMDNPFSAIYGPDLIDFEAAFLSRRTIAETGIIQDIVMFDEECLEDCMFRAADGEYGYAVSTAQAGSPSDAANVWWSDDGADTWAVTSTNPFAAAEDISSVVKMGTVQNHRIVVARGSTDAGNPAEIAYADVTTIGQTAWVNVDVGAVNGEYINMLEWPVFNRMFAVTSLGNVYKSTDGGVTWANVYDAVANNEMYDVSFTKDGEGWVVGDTDLLLHTTDWGNSWDVVVGPNDGLYNLTTCDVDMEKKLIVGDSNGGIFGTVDRGNHWVTTPPQGVTATDVQRIRSDGYWKWCIVHIAAVSGFEGNSRVLRSTDGGATWRLWDLETNIDPNNGLYAMYVVDPNRCIVGGAPYPVHGTSLLTRTETDIDRIVT
jgi:photosystem II stability/assembly factor-like uncharacterized protein